MTTQIDLYNSALLELGERRLVSLTDENEARRALDDVWRGGDIKDLFLQSGFWNFAMRTAEVTYSPSITPEFGYRYAFDRPEDWIRTAGLSADEYFSNPLDYTDEQQYVFADVETVYWKYVSKDDEYGYDMSQWPASFVRWVEVYLAYRIARRVTGSATIQGDFYKLQERYLIEARSHDAMNEAIAYPPRGSWVRSRASLQGDRGKRSRLIG